MNLNTRDNVVVQIVFFLNYFRLYDGEQGSNIIIRKVLIFWAFFRQKISLVKLFFKQYGTIFFLILTDLSSDMKTKGLAL